MYLQRGDSALDEDPTYFGVLDVFRAAGARIAGVAVEAQGVSPATLRQRIIATSSRLVYLTPTFQNPTGALMPRVARKELARIAGDLGVPIIDDCTLFDLSLEGSPPPPIAAFAPDAPVITLGSLSKLVWPGLRIGWVRAPKAIVERLVRLKSAIDLGGPLMSVTGRYASFTRIPFIAEPESLRTGIRRLAAAWRDYRSGPHRTTEMVEQRFAMV